MRRLTEEEMSQVNGGKLGLNGFCGGTHMLAIASCYFGPAGILGAAGLELGAAFAGCFERQKEY